MNREYSLTIGGRELVIETGKLAEQANGAVTVRYGDTVVLVTACCSPQPREGVDFFPLTVDYEERLYAAGKIPGGFFKREGRPTQEAILAMRLTDRCIRPLFPRGFRNEVQVVITVLSADQENDPDILAIIGASAALSTSEIPFAGPLAATRMGYVEGEFVINPTFTELGRSQLDLVVAGTRDAVLMVEAGGSEVQEDIILEAIRRGQEVNKEVIRLQDQLIAEDAKAKIAYVSDEPGPEVVAAVSSFLESRWDQVMALGGKGEREEALATLKSELVAALGESYPEKSLVASLESQVKALIRAQILDAGIRPSGRGLNEIRPISCEVGLLPRTHGSGLFTRGQTQVLTIATLGSGEDEQILDGLTQEESKRFMHHYNFPPFSTGEVKRMGSPARREVGHGALAERALTPVIPSEEEFPYTIRLVSEVLSSNGSTSMASVCGSSLSLMDAGVPIKAPVAGIAMGLVMGDNVRYAVLTDIEGVEDAWGDMDFKVAGTVVGITALQMDIKSRGVSVEIMGEALSQARVARLQILEKMQQTISASRPELSRYAPRMVKITVPVDKIRYVIGPGGRVIRSITDETKVTLEVQNDGTIILGSPNEDAIKKAIAIIESLTRDVEVGTIYTGKVTRVTNFGAFVEILPDKEGLVHISELAEHRVERVEDVVKVGDEIQVMVIEIDRQGRVNLSHRAIHKGLEATLAEPRRSVIEPSGPRRLDSRPRRYPGDRFPSPTERRPMPPRRPLGPR